jgi:hypothetical protein
MTLGLFRNGVPIESEIVAGSELSASWTVTVGPDGDRFRVQLESGGTPVVVTSHIHALPADAPPGGGCWTAGSGGASPYFILYLMVWVAIARNRRRREARW